MGPKEAGPSRSEGRRTGRPQEAEKEGEEKPQQPAPAAPTPIPTLATPRRQGPDPEAVETETGL